MMKKSFMRQKTLRAWHALVCLVWWWAGPNIGFAPDAYAASPPRPAPNCALDVNILNPSAFICQGGSVMLETFVTGNSGLVTYSWSPAIGLSDPTSPNPTAAPSVSVTYTVTVMDEAMCSATATVTVIVAPAALSDFPEADNSGGSRVTCAVTIGNIAYVGGSFTQFGGLPRNRLAAFDLNTGQVTSWNPGANNTVLALATDGTNIYVGGQFTTIGSVVRPRAAAVTPSGVVTSFDPNADGTVRTLAIDGSTVYLGGEFTDVGASTGKVRLAAVDKTTGAVNMAFTANANNTVRDLLVNAGNLYVVGDFSTIQSMTRNRAAAIDLSTGNLTGFNPNANNTVRAVAAHGGFIYIAGDFTQVSSLSRPRLAQLNATTGAPTSFAPNPNNTVFDLQVEGNTLYLVGSFTSVSSAPRNNIAAIDLSTNTLKSWNPSANNVAETIFEYGCRVFVGGQFSMVDGRSAIRFAALDDGDVPNVTVTGPSNHCPGTSSNLTASGGTQYLWCNTGQTTSSITVDPAVTTTYTVAAIVGGCVVTKEFTLNVVGAASVNLGPDISACAGDVVTLNAGAGFTSYQWFKDGNPLTGQTFQTLNVTTSGIYSVDVVNSFGCPATDDVVVTFNPLPTVGASAMPSAICVGQTTTLTATGAVSYTWMPGSLTGASVTVSPASTTTYTVTGTDANGCQNTATVTVTVHPLPTVGASAMPSAICVGQSTTLTASGAVSYTWMPGSLTGASVMVSPTMTTEYTVTGTDANGCVNTATVTVTVNPLPTVGASATPSAICVGQSTTLTASGAVSYTWMPGSLTGASVMVSPTMTTEYTVTGTDANGCQNTATVTVTVNPLPTVGASATPTAICVGQNTTLTATGAVSYTWMPGSLTGASVMVSPTMTTEYTVTGTDANGCVNTATVTVTVNPLPTVGASATPTAICVGQNTTLTATGAVSYTWMPGSLTGASVMVSPTMTTEYTVTGTDANGCVNTATVTVTVNPLPTVGASATPTAICVGQSTTLTATGAVSYTWMPGSLTGASVTVSPASTTTYTVTGTDANGCQNTATVTVTVHPLPTVGASATPTAICVGQSTTLTATGAVSYTWMPGSLTGASVMVSPTMTTEYTVTGTDANGCVNTATVTVTVNPLPTVGIYFGGGGVLCPYSTITLYADPGFASYQWYKDGNPVVGAVNPTLVVSTAGSYTVEVSDANGCTNQSLPAVISAPPPGVGDPMATLPPVDGAVYAMVRVGNILYIGGAFANVGTTPRNRLAAINVSDGTVTPWNPGPDNNVFALEYDQATNQIFVGGQFTNIASNTRNRAAAFDATTGNLTAWNPNANGNVRAIAIKGDTVFLGGQFSTIGGSGANRRVAAVNKTNGARYTGLAVDLPAGNVRALYADKNSNTLFIGGNFNTINAATRNYLGAVNTQDGTLRPFDPNLNNQVFDIEVHGQYLYFGGSFTSVGTDPNYARVAAVDTATGAIFAAFDPNVNNGLVTALAFEGNLLYMVGTFTNVNSSTRQRFAVVNKNTGALNSFVKNVNGTINDIDIKSCNVIIGGAFTNAGTRLHLFAGPSTPTVTVTGDMTICKGEVTVITGSGTDNYLWCNVGQIGNPIALAPVVTETFTVYGYNNDGCWDMDVFTITVHPLPNATITPLGPTTFCAGGSVTLDAGPGYATYQWLESGKSIPGETMQTLNVTASGDYSVVVTTSAGCVDTSASVSVTVHPLPTPTISTSDLTTFCAGGSALLEVDAPYNAYQWYLNGNLISDATNDAYTATVSGVYHIEVTDANTCKNISNTITITVHPLPTVDAGVDTTICIGSSIDLTAVGSGGTGTLTYEWNWSGGGPLAGETITVSPTVTTEYTVTVTDANGCTDVDAVIVTVNTFPQVTIVPDGPTTFCDGDVVLLDASNAYDSYQWYLDGNPIAGATSSTFLAEVGGDYSVEVVYNNGCTDADTITVTVYPLPNVSITPSGPTSFCPGDSVTLDAGAWDIYLWSTGATTQTITVTEAGIYTVLVQNSFGCFNTADISVVVFDEPSVTIVPDGPIAFCDGGSVTLDAGTGFASYLWSTGETTQTITVGLSGTYTVAVVDTGSGCSASAFITVTVFPLPVATISGDLSICDGDATTLTTGVFASYQWYLNDVALVGETGQSLVTDVAGFYTVLVVDDNGCVDISDSVEVIVNPLPDVVITPDGPLTFCAPGSVTLDAGEWDSYLWNTNHTGRYLTVTQSGTYSVFVTDSNGCFNTSLDVLVTVYDQVEFDVEIVHPSCPTCTDGEIVATGTAGQPPFEFTLNGGTPQPGVFTGLDVGIYDIDAFDDNGCTSDTTVELVVCEQPTIVSIDQISGSSGQVRWNSEQPQPSAPYGRFRLEYREIAPGTGAWISISPLTDTTYVINGLNSGYTYQVRVRYECSGGYSVWSNAASFTTLANVCNAPTNVVTAPAGSGNRAVSWGATPNAISYALAYGPVLVNPSTWATVIVPAPTTTYTLTGLNPSVTYRVRVLANCTSDPTNTVQGPGTSPWSLTSASFKPNTRLGYDETELQSITLYPNPNSGTFNIVVKSAQTSTAVLNLTDALGRTVYQTRFDAAAGENQFQVVVPSNVTSGIYMVNVTLNGVTSKTKVVIE